MQGNTVRAKGILRGFLLYVPQTCKGKTLFPFPDRVLQDVLRTLQELARIEYVVGIENAFYSRHQLFLFSTER